MTQQEISRQVREETQQVVTEATAQICDSVERVMSSLLKEIAAQMGPRRGEAETPELQAHYQPLAEGRMSDGVVDYQFVDGWDVIRWQGQINSNTYERVARATCDILNDLGDQGERRVLLDLTQVPVVSAGAAAAVAEVRSHARRCASSPAPASARRIWPGSSRATATARAARCSTRAKPPSSPEPPCRGGGTASPRPGLPLAGSPGAD